MVGASPESEEHDHTFNRNHRCRVFARLDSTAATKRSKDLDITGCKYLVTGCKLPVTSINTNQQVASYV
jgi:hypothetical protein